VRNILPFRGPDRTDIRAYSIESAYAIRWDDIIGSIEVGKRADLIVVDRNLFEITTDEIKVLSHCSKQ